MLKLARALPSSAKRLYHLLPPEWRRVRLVNALKSRILPHDALYNQTYFESMESLAAAAAPVIARSIVTTFHPHRIIDVGCGTGDLLLELQKQNCESVGLEYARAALERCRAKGLDARRFDLEHDVSERLEKFDVAISLEVGEHLPAAFADRYLDLLTGLAPIIVFTAAVPGQGGVDHVNEQPHAYWLSKFRARGFRADEHRANAWRNAWQATGQVAPWYSGNLMVLEQITD